VETGGHGMMGWGPAASTLKDMQVRPVLSAQANTSWD